jgi:hypothetical protein
MRPVFHPEQGQPVTFAAAVVSLNGWSPELRARQWAVSRCCAMALHCVSLPHRPVKVDVQALNYLPPLRSSSIRHSPPAKLITRVLLPVSETMFDS